MAETEIRRVKVQDPLETFRALPIDEVERRLLRAMKTIRALPDKEARFNRYNNGWPEIVQEQIDAYGDHEQPKFSPKPFDVSDVLVALEWANVLERNEYKLVWARSFDCSFRQIGMRIGRSDETARRRYHDALIKVWSRANRLR